VVVEAVAVLMLEVLLPLAQVEQAVVAVEEKLELVLLGL
jgi:hypothetical protein